MGIGDEVMASGMARGALARGKRIAFGDGTRIIWGLYGDMVFRGNPNVARPGDEGAPDIEWNHFYQGHRTYVRPIRGKNWEFNDSFRATPGELFFSATEDAMLDHIRHGFVVIDPNVAKKDSAINKQWPRERYEAIAAMIIAAGHRVVQFVSPDAPYHLENRTDAILTVNWRAAASLLRAAKLWIGPEGGMHHTAAALGIPAVVLFGAWIHPRTTGYPLHENIYVGDEKPCGALKPCAHCREAMSKITVEDVIEAAERATTMRKGANRC